MSTVQIAALSRKEFNRLAGRCGEEVNGYSSLEVSRSVLSRRLRRHLYGTYLDATYCLPPLLINI
jgi:hypothetical protein